MGAWIVHALSAAPHLAADLSKQLSGLAKQRAVQWDLREIGALDHVGAIYLLRAWGHKLPDTLLIDDEHRGFFKSLLDATMLAGSTAKPDWLRPVRGIGEWLVNFADHAKGFAALLGQIVLDFGRFVARPHAGPWREISANVFRSGSQALGITALVGFLIGVVLTLQLIGVE